MTALDIYPETKLTALTKSRKQDVIDRKEYLGVDLSPVFHATKVAEPPHLVWRHDELTLAEVTRYLQVCVMVSLS